MKIKCIANTGKDLPLECLDPAAGYDKEHEFALEIDKTYTVYALTIFRGCVWYYICDEDYVYYPIWNPAPLFEVIDGRMSKHWKYNFIQATTQTRFVNSEVIFAFAEWSNNPFEYYDKLTDREEKEVSLFEFYKNLLDVEFPDLSNTKKATDLGENWVMCPDCDETWEVLVKSGMLKCPKCNALLHNPFYSDE